MKLLVTAFEPFGGESLNPSALVLEKLTAPADMTLEKRILPVTFQGAPKALKEAVLKFKPDAVLSLGQAGGRAAVTPEWVGINWMDARIPDNEGFQPRQQKIDPSGPDAYFSTLPVYLLSQAAANVGVPSQVSLSAGAYVCNCVLYCALRLAATTCSGLRAAFVHLPFLPEQATDKNAPCLTLEQMVLAVQAMLNALAAQ